MRVKKNQQRSSATAARCALRVSFEGWGCRCEMRISSSGSLLPGRRGTRMKGAFWGTLLFFFFFTLVTGPRRSLSLKLIDTRVYEPQYEPASVPQHVSHISVKWVFLNLGNLAIIAGSESLSPLRNIFLPFQGSPSPCPS